MVQRFSRGCSLNEWQKQGTQSSASRVYNLSTIHLHIQPTRSLLLKVWSMDQLHWPNLEAYQGCRISGPISDLLNLNLCFNKIPTWSVGVPLFERHIIWPLSAFMTSVFYPSLCPLRTTFTGHKPPSVSRIMSNTLPPLPFALADFFSQNTPFLILCTDSSSLFRSQL